MKPCYYIPTTIKPAIVAERISAKQLILYRISASVCIYVCVTLRNAITLHTVHGVAGPFVAQFYVLLPRVLAEVESQTTTARRVGKGLGILLHYAKESNERNTKPKLKDQRVRSHKTRDAYTY